MRPHDGCAEEKRGERNRDNGVKRESSPAVERTTLFSHAVNLKVVVMMVLEGQ